MKKFAAGDGLSGVNISSFNYAGISEMSDSEGNFAISDDVSALVDLKTPAMSVEYDGKTVLFRNVHAAFFKISLLDALGKVALGKTFGDVSGNLYFDLGNLPRKWKFLCVKMDNRNEVYSLDKKGVLKKGRRSDGDSPLFQGRLRKRNLPDDVRE